MLTYITNIFKTIFLQPFIDNIVFLILYGNMGQRESENHEKYSQSFSNNFHSVTKLRFRWEKDDFCW